MTCQNMNSPFNTANLPHSVTGGFPGQCYCSPSLSPLSCSVTHRNGHHSRWRCLALRVLACLGLGLTTLLGALPAVMGVAVTSRGVAGMLGFAGGAMLATVALTLLPAGLRQAGAVAAAVAFAGGGAVTHLLDLLIPHTHHGGNGQTNDDPLRSSILLATATVMHNLPEGLSVGASLAGGRIRTGLTVAAAIGAHNIPEGLAIVMPLCHQPSSRKIALSLAAGSGLLEAVAALGGLLAARLPPPATGWLLAAAGGAMVYAVFHEILPQSLRRGHLALSGVGLVAGVLVTWLLTLILAG